MRQFALRSLYGFLFAEYTRHTGGKVTSFIYLFTYPTAFRYKQRSFNVCNVAFNNNRICKINGWNKLWVWNSTVVTSTSDGKIFFGLLWNGFNTVADLETIRTVTNNIIVLLQICHIFLQLEKILPKKFEIRQNLGPFLLFKSIKVWISSKH